MKKKWYPSYAIVHYSRRGIELAPRIFFDLQTEVLLDFEAVFQLLPLLCVTVEEFSLGKDVFYKQRSFCMEYCELF